MTAFFNKYFLPIILILITSFLSGCTKLNVDNSSGTSVEQAQHYLKNARLSQGTTRTNWLLLAAESLLIQQRTDKTITVLNTINSSELTEKSLQLYFLLMAQAFTGANRTDQAMTYYIQITQPELLKKYQQISFYRDYAELLQQMKRYYDSAIQRISLSKLLTDVLEIEENRELLWLSLMQVNNLGIYRNSLNGLLVSGWLELANLAKVHAGQPDVLITKLDQWRSMYVDHPAYAHLPIDMARAEAARSYRPQYIALLLPQTGNLANSAQQIRDGFMTALYQIPVAERPEIRFYDSSKSADILSLYQQVIDEGANFVIGPLNRELVQTLTTREHFPVPVMSINRLVDDLLLPDNFYQFGLPVEDEARQTADKAWQDGLSQALVLVPEGTMGDRTSIAFTEQFERLGGKIQKTITYNMDKDQDYSRAVQELLGVDKSISRYSRLQEILGVPIKHNARRRQDSDLIFFKASVKQARRIKPFIDFYYGHDLPLYSTSSIYGGKEEPMLDRDLDNVLFCDIPWLLSDDNEIINIRKTISNIWPTSTYGSTGRFFALGYDLFTLIPDLNKLRNFPHYYKPGLSGLLSVNQLGHIKRKLTWAKFINGKSFQMSQSLHQ